MRIVMYLAIISFTILAGYEIISHSLTKEDAKSSLCHRFYFNFANLMN